MRFFSALPGQFILFAAYALCFAALNSVALMISLFYRKKLRKSSPRAGFVFAIALVILCCCLMLGARYGASFMAVVARLALAGSAVASVIATTQLFYHAKGAKVTLWQTL